MDVDERIAEANAQLDRLLGFFPRIDGKASTFFAMNATVLGIATLNLRPEDLQQWYIVVPAFLGLLLTIASLGYIYLCMLPHLDGGQRSLIYFREIASVTEANYVAEYKGRSATEHLNDLLGQIWRNSEILKLKFSAVNRAFQLMLFSLIPWVIFLGVTSIVHSQVPAVN